MLYTVGHGTRTSDELAALLTGAGIEVVVDIRIAPGSRRHPQFNRSQLERWLPEAGLAYRWEPRLGGHRKLPPDSPDVALRNSSFRAYASHMRTAPFEEAMAELVEQTTRQPTAVMCSESLWWRCHRRLVADRAVLVDAVPVVHLMSGGRLSGHRVTPGAREVDGVLLYDDVEGQVPLL